MRATWIRIAVVLGVLVGCDGQKNEGEVEERAAVEPARSVQRAELALSYAPAEHEKDIARAQEALRTAPSSVDAHLALATALMRRGRETSRAIYATYARDVLAAARSLDAADHRVRTLTTMLLLDEHKFEAAANAAKELARAQPDDPTPKLLLGDARLELGDYDEAIEAYQSAVDLRPDLRSYNRGAFLRWLQGDFDGAVKVMELALQAGSARDPEAMAWCFVDLGNMYLHRGDARRAKAAAERAQELVAGYVPARVLNGRALALLGDTQAAIVELTAAVDQRPNAEDFLRLVELHESLGDPDAAKNVLAQAEILTPTDPRPMALFLARRNESPQGALKLARLELATRHNLWSHDTLALALLRAGQPHDAKQAIDKALAWNTPDASFRLHAALIDAVLGEPASARTHLDAALALDPTVDPRLVAELRSKLGDA
jgi:tetratricopeptide (TPR) repeat protein